MQAIEIKNLIKIFDNITVFDNPGLSINEDEFFCLIDPNSSGKTT